MYCKENMEFRKKLKKHLKLEKSNSLLEYNMWSVC